MWSWSPHAQDIAASCWSRRCGSRRERAGPRRPPRRAARQTYTAAPPFASLFPLEEAWTITLPALAGGAGRARRVARVRPSRQRNARGARLAARRHGLVGAAPRRRRAPVAADGVVYVAAGDAVHALDAATGAVRWMAPATAPAQVLRLAAARVLAIGVRHDPGVRCGFGRHAMDTAAGGCRGSPGCGRRATTRCSSRSPTDA